MTNAPYWDKLYKSSQKDPAKNKSLLKKLKMNREEITYDLLPKGGSYLDIGCGEGFLVFRAKNKFKNVYGVDASEIRIQRINKKTKKF